MHMDLFEVKEENKDLKTDSQTECSEAEGGLPEEADTRTGIVIYQTKRWKVKPGSRYLQNYIKAGHQLSGVVIVDIDDLAHGGLQAPIPRRYTILKN